MRVQKSKIVSTGIPKFVPMQAVCIETDYKLLGKLILPFAKLAIKLKMIEG